LHVFDGVVDIGISSEVWDKVVLLVRGSGLSPVPLVTKLGLGICKMSSSETDIAVFTEVWDEIVFLEAFVRFWGPGSEWLSVDFSKSLQQFKFSISTWYNPFFIISISLWSKDVLEGGLCTSNMLVLRNHIRIISEVWDEIINWMTFLGARGPGSEWFSSLGDSSSLNGCDQAQSSNLLHF